MVKGHREPMALQSQVLVEPKAVDTSQNGSISVLIKVPLGTIKMISDSSRNGCQAANYQTSGWIW
jgi:hypothetical protein